MSLSMMRDFEASLDLIESFLSQSKPAVLITTGTGKCFCNGLDIQSINKSPQSNDLEGLENTLNRMLARVLGLSIPTIALIQGHAFGGGFMLAVAHDFQIMRSDRGWVCIPAVNLGIVLPSPYLSLLKVKFQSQKARDLLLLGNKFTGPEALDFGLVEMIETQENLRPKAMNLAASLIERNFHTPTFGSMKKLIFQDILSQLLASSPSNSFLSNRTPLKPRLQPLQFLPL
eukprot:TRINITY_DN15503_c0_g1_i1.p1 TRINITY_DN15503_c0_g1~~TRINITY_DN15503_c0_g1_i1.p1  ORF type:complete len:266 (-),score=90.08 TRINITY_DN15503_c0_g1_i1:53-742(-)